MGVVVDHQPALPQTAEIKAPSWGLEGGYRLTQLGKRNPLQPAGGHGRNRVAEVVTTGQGQFKAAHQFTVFKEVGNGAVTPLLLGNRCKGDACGAFDRPPMTGFEPLAQHRVVVVCQEP